MAEASTTEKIALARAAFEDLQREIREDCRSLGECPDRALCICPGPGNERPHGG